MTGRAGRPVPRAVAALLGAAVGATAWLSLGVVGVIDPVRLTRLVALPPAAWLAALAGAGAVVGGLARPPLALLAPLSLLALPWLPWLPFRVPPAFLLWDGPLEGAVWVAAIGGAAFVAWRAARAPVPSRDGGDASGRAAWLAGLLALVVALSAWLAVRPRVPAGDEPHYLVITQSLLRDGDLRIEDNHRDEQYLAYFEGALKPDFMRRGVDGQIYSIHAPGTSVVVLPAFAAAGYPGAVVTVTTLVGLGVMALWRAARLLTGSTGAAWAAAAALVAASPYVLMAFTIYPDPIGSAIVAAGLLVLVRLDSGVALGPRTWMAVGAGLAVLPWLHTRFAVVAGAFGAVLAVRAWQGRGGGRDALRLLAVPALSAAAWFGFFQVIYGTPDPGAPYGAGSGSGLAFVPTGLAGLLVDQQFGLWANAPALAGAAAGLVWLVATRPRLAAELGIVVLPYLVTAASFPMWWGGYSSPARFAIVVVPAMALLVAPAWARGGTVGRAGLAAALVVSAMITAAVLGVDRGAFVYNSRDGHALLLDWLSAAVDVTLAAPSVHRDGPAGALADAAAWAMAVGLVVALAARVPRLAGTLAWAGTPLVVMAAGTVVWAGHHDAVVTVPTSSLRYLSAWRDGRLPVAAQLSPTRRLEADGGIGRLLLSRSARGAPPPGAPPLLQVPGVPAGEYDVFIEADGAPAGTAEVQVGRQGRGGLSTAHWRLDGRPPGFGGLTLRLPVDVHSVSVLGDTAAQRSVRAVALRPRTLAPRGRPWALRAARYGAVVVYALDDYAYLEAGAFWTRGARSAGVVVQPDTAGPVAMRLTAGPVPTRVRLAAGRWSRDVALPPDGAIDVTLPEEALAPAVLSIATEDGFRPSSYGGSGDVRWLGVYVTWPGAPAPGR